MTVSGIIGAITCTVILFVCQFYLPPFFIFFTQLLLPFPLIHCAFKGTLKQGLLVTGMSTGILLALSLAGHAAAPIEGATYALVALSVSLPLVLGFAYSWLYFHPLDGTSFDFRPTLVLIGNTILNWIVFSSTSTPVISIETLKKANIPVEPLQAQPEVWQNFLVVMEWIQKLSPTLLALTSFFSILVSILIYRVFLRTRKLIPAVGIGLFQIRTLPPAYLWIIVGLLVTGIWGPSPVNNLAICLTGVAFIPVLFLGLSILHTLSRRWQLHPLPIIVMYIVMALFIWLLVPVLVLGLIEPWTKLKQKLQPLVDH